MEEIWDFVQGNMLNAQECQRRLANQKCREVNYNVGDYVWLSLQDYPTGQRSHTFGLQQAGPFKVLE